MISSSYKIQLTGIFLFLSLIFLPIKIEAAFKCQYPEIFQDYYENDVSPESSIKTSISSINIFLNHHSAMKGFVVENPDNTSSIKYNYRTIIDELPFLSSQLDTSIEPIFQKYIVSPEVLTGSQISSAYNQKFYECTDGEAACDNQVSEIDTVMTLAAKDPNYFSIIVTDLMFSDVNTNLDDIIAKIFKQNQAIGIYRIKSKFNGFIFPLPSGKQYNKADSRPFYIITIGQQDQILNFNKLINTSILNNINENHYNFTLFSNDLVRTAVVPFNTDKNLIKTQKGSLKDNTIVGDNKNLQQFDIQRNHDPLLANFNLDKIQVPYTIYLDLTTEVGNLKNAEIRIWRLNEKGDGCSKKWVESGKTYELVNIKQDNNKINLEIFGKKQSEFPALKSKKIYFINIKLVANSLMTEQVDNELNEWDFTRPTENEFTSKGGFFPTWNIKKFYSLLMTVQENEYEKREKLVPIELNFIFKKSR